MHEKRERCFQIIDELIDKDVNVFDLYNEVSIREYYRIKKRFERVFGGLKQALHAYGLYDPIGTPTDLEIARCFYICEHSYEVLVYECRKYHILDIYNIQEKEFKAISYRLVGEFELDALDLFYRDNFPFEGLPSDTIQEKYPKLYGYMRKHYKTIRSFINFYGWPYDVFVDRDYGCKRVRWGLMFEKKLGDMLISLHGKDNVAFRRRVEDSIPDFIVNDTWIDAKLSSWSIFDSRTDTVDKYLKHTDKLIIYYALGNQPSWSKEGCKLAHVSELYPKLRDVGRNDVVTDMEGFISHISSVA